MLIADFSIHRPMKKAPPLSFVFFFAGTSTFPVKYIILQKYDIFLITSGKFISLEIFFLVLNLKTIFFNLHIHKVTVFKRS